MPNPARNLTFLLILISFCAFSQVEYLDGFVVLHNGDTLMGKILNQPNTSLAKKCTFSNEALQKTFTPREVVSFGITRSNRMFETNVIQFNKTNDTVFLEYLVHGIVDLFYLAYPTNEYYFLRKDGQLLILENLKKMVTIQKDYGNSYSLGTYNVPKELYKGILNYAFSGVINPTEINATKYDYKSLSKITTKYHDNVCDWECEVFRKSTKREIWISPQVSEVISKMSLSGSPDR